MLSCVSYLKLEADAAEYRDRERKRNTGDASSTKLVHCKSTTKFNQLRFDPFPSLPITFGIGKENEAELRVSHIRAPPLDWARGIGGQPRETQHCPTDRYGGVQVSIYGCEFLKFSPCLWRLPTLPGDAAESPAPAPAPAEASTTATEVQPQATPEFTRGEGAGLERAPGQDNHVARNCQRRELFHLLSQPAQQNNISW